MITIMVCFAMSPIVITPYSNFDFHLEEEARRLDGGDGSSLINKERQEASRELSRPLKQSDEGQPVQGGLCLFLQNAQGDVHPLDLNTDATVQDLLTAVEEYTSVPTVVSYAGRRLDQKDALLSDVGIAQEAIVYSHPMRKMRVLFEQISLECRCVFISSALPSKDRIIEVPYLDDVLPITQLVDSIRNSLISKVKNGHWKQALRGNDVCMPGVELHQVFEDFLACGGADRIFVSLLPSPQATRVANGHGCAQALQHLKQQNVGIDQQEFDKMIADMRFAGLNPEDMYICMQILN